MRTHSLWVLGPIAGLALAACTTPGTSRYEQASYATGGADAQLMSHRIRNWSAPNDHTLIFEAVDGTRYKAETVGPCFGLDFAQRIGFSSHGHTDFSSSSSFEQVDRFSSVVLPDGTRCPFQNFGKVVSPATQALDSFEKLSTTQPGNEATSR